MSLPDPFPGHWADVDVLQPLPKDGSPLLLVPSGPASSAQQRLEDRTNQVPVSCGDPCSEWKLLTPQQSRRTRTGLLPPLLHVSKPPVVDKEQVIKRDGADWLSVCRAPRFGWLEEKKPAPAPPTPQAPPKPSPEKSATEDEPAAAVMCECGLHERGPSTLIIATQNRIEMQAAAVERERAAAEEQVRLLREERHRLERQQLEMHRLLVERSKSAGIRLSQLIAAEPKVEIAIFS